MVTTLPFTTAVPVPVGTYVNAFGVGAPKAAKSTLLTFP
jgi:hypothetical protein